MRLGAHISGAGGLEKAFARGAEVGCETIMLFTKSNRQWKARVLSEDDLERFREEDAAHPEITPTAAHASYLINLASSEPALWERSYQALVVELQRCGMLGIPTLTLHPGAATDGDIDGAIERIARGVGLALEETETDAADVTLCLETMAGQGAQIGHRFEQIGQIFSLVQADTRLAVCLDTCHVFAAGYDYRTRAGYDALLDAFERHVGLSKIRCFHLNDSVYPLGSRKDRHAHIGEGEIGLEPFGFWLNDPQWKAHPGHLETPKHKKVDGPDGPEMLAMDAVNLATLRGLLA